MKNIKFIVLLLSIGFYVSCESAKTNSNTNAGNSNSAANEVLVLSETDRPQNIVDMMKSRGEQDEAKPTLKFLEPTDGATINSSTVKVKLEISGELKGYMPMKDPGTGMGNHIHIILDNQPYEAYYNLEQEFELQNVSDGSHVLRVFPSRPWHESYKNEGAFQMIKFIVKNGGADTSKPATTNSGQTIANSNKEFKTMQESFAVGVDDSRPLLTYSRPKGEYKAADADAIMIDFWLVNGKLIGDGGEYKIRYSVDGGEAKFIEKWAPIWLQGWSDGKRIIKLELIGKDGKLVENGGFNSTEREIAVSK